MGNKKPASYSFGRVLGVCYQKLALAVFVKRPQSETNWRWMGELSSFSSCCQPLKLEGYSHRGIHTNSPQKLNTYLSANERK